MPGDDCPLPNEKTSLNSRTSATSEISDTSLLQVKRSRLCPFPKRYILTIMLFIGHSLLMLIRTGMSVAVVAMVKNSTVILNGTITTVPEFDWSPKMQGLLLGSFYFGCAPIQIPAGMLSNKFGGKVTFFCGVLGLGVFNILTPTIARLGPLPLLIVMKILEGAVEGLSAGSIQTLCSKWMPPLEGTRMTTSAFSGVFLGMMLGMILSGAIADSVGWQWIFYIYGVCAVVFCLFWFWLISETPNDHPTITSDELEYITNSIGSRHKDSTPWKSVLTSLPFWAFAVSHFICYWNYFTLILQLPTFLSDTLRISLHTVGFLSALPFPVTLIVILAGGQLADLIRSHAWLSTTNVRKLFFCTGFVGQGVTLVVACQLIREPVAMIFLTLSAGFAGLEFASLIVSPQDIAPPFADIIWTISTTGGLIASFSSSTVAGALTTNKTPEEWQHVFYLGASLLFVGCVVSFFFVSGSLQSWAQPSTASADEKPDQTTHNHEPTSKAEHQSSE